MMQRRLMSRVVTATVPVRLLIAPSVSLDRAQIRFASTKAQQHNPPPAAAEGLPNVDKAGKPKKPAAEDDTPSKKRSHPKKGEPESTKATGGGAKDKNGAKGDKSKETPKVEVRTGDDVPPSKQRGDGGNGGGAVSYTYSSSSSYYSSTGDGAGAMTARYSGERSEASSDGTAYWTSVDLQLGADGKFKLSERAGTGKGPKPSPREHEDGAEQWQTAQGKWTAHRGRVDFTVEKLDSKGVDKGTDSVESKERGTRLMLKPMDKEFSLSLDDLTRGEPFTSPVFHAPLMSPAVPQFLLELY